MRTRNGILISALFLGFGAVAVAAPDTPHLAQLRAVPVKSGVNPVRAMTADGRPGQIVQGFKNYFTGDGSHDVIMVLTHGPGASDGWSVVTVGKSLHIDPNDAVTFTNAPHTGEDMVRSVRFARAMLDGEPAFVALVAQRGMEGPIPAASHVTVSIYALETDQDVGADIFVLKGQTKLRDCYGNADLALNLEMGLALPPGYEGPQSASACGSF